MNVHLTTDQLTNLESEGIPQQVNLVYANVSRLPHNRGFRVKFIKAKKMGYSMLCDRDVEYIQGEKNYDTLSRINQVIRDTQAELIL